MSRFIAVDRYTDYLLPPSVDDWLPENHLARFIVEVTEKLLRFCTAMLGTTSIISLAGELQFAAVISRN